MFILLDGLIEVQVQPKQLQSLEDIFTSKYVGCGSQIGDFDLFSNTVRSASAIAMNKSICLSIKKSVFDSHIQEFYHSLYTENMNFVFNLKIFEGISNKYQFIKLFFDSFSQRVRFSKEQIVFSEKNEPDCIYFILSGTFLIKKLSSNSSLREFITPEKKSYDERYSNSLKFAKSEYDLNINEQKAAHVYYNVFELQKGDFFGEEDIIENNQNRSYLVCCSSVSGGELFKISRQVFEEVFLKHYTIQQYFQENLPIKKQLISQKVNKAQQINRRQIIKNDQQQLIIRSNNNKFDNIIESASSPPSLVSLKYIQQQQQQQQQQYPSSSMVSLSQQKIQNQVHKSINSLTNLKCINEINDEIAFDNPSQQNLQMVEANMQNNPYLNEEYQNRQIINHRNSNKYLVNQRSENTKQSIGSLHDLLDYAQSSIIMLQQQQHINNQNQQLQNAEYSHSNNNINSGDQNRDNNQPIGYFNGKQLQQINQINQGMHNKISSSDLCVLIENEQDGKQQEECALESIKQKMRQTFEFDMDNFMKQKIHAQKQIIQQQRRNNYSAVKPRSQLQQQQDYQMVYAQQRSQSENIQSSTIKQKPKVKKNKPTVTKWTNSLNQNQDQMVISGEISKNFQKNLKQICFKFGRKDFHSLKKSLNHHIKSKDFKQILNANINDVRDFQSNKSGLQDRSKTIHEIAQKINYIQNNQIKNNDHFNTKQEQTQYQNQYQLEEENNLQFFQQRQQEQEELQNQQQTIESKQINIKQLESQPSKDIGKKQNDNDIQIVQNTSPKLIQNKSPLEAKEVKSQHPSSPPKDHHASEDLFKDFKSWKQISFGCNSPENNRLELQELRLQQSQQFSSVVKGLLSQHQQEQIKLTNSLNSQKSKAQQNKIIEDSNKQQNEPEQTKYNQDSIIEAPNNKQLTLQQVNEGNIKIEKQQNQNLTEEKSTKDYYIRDSLFQNTHIQEQYPNIYSQDGEQSELNCVFSTHEGTIQSPQQSQNYINFTASVTPYYVPYTAYKSIQSQSTPQKTKNVRPFSSTFHVANSFYNNDQQGINQDGRLANHTYNQYPINYQNYNNQTQSQAIANQQSQFTSLKRCQSSQFVRLKESKLNQVRDKSNELKEKRQMNTLFNVKRSQQSQNRSNSPCIKQLDNILSMQQKSQQRMTPQKSNSNNNDFISVDSPLMSQMPSSNQLKRTQENRDEINSFSIRSPLRKQLQRIDQNNLSTSNLKQLAITPQKPQIKYHFQSKLSSQMNSNNLSQPLLSKFYSNQQSSMNQHNRSSQTKFFPFFQADLQTNRSLAQASSHDRISRQSSLHQASQMQESANINDIQQQPILFSPDMFQTEITKQYPNRISPIKNQQNFSSEKQQIQKNAIIKQEEQKYNQQNQQPVQLQQQFQNDNFKVQDNAINQQQYNANPEQQTSSNANVSEQEKSLENQQQKNFQSHRKLVEIKTQEVNSEKKIEERLEEVIPKLKLSGQLQTHEEDENLPKKETAVNDSFGGVKKNKKKNSLTQSNLTPVFNKKYFTFQNEIHNTKLTESQDSQAFTNDKGTPPTFQHKWQQDSIQLSDLALLNPSDAKVDLKLNIIKSEQKEEPNKNENNFFENISENSSNVNTNTNNNNCPSNNLEISFSQHRSSYSEIPSPQPLVFIQIKEQPQANAKTQNDAKISNDAKTLNDDYTKVENMNNNFNIVINEGEQTQNQQKQQLSQRQNQNASMMKHSMIYSTIPNIQEENSIEDQMDGQSINGNQNKFVLNTSMSAISQINPLESPQYMRKRHSTQLSHFFPVTQKELPASKQSMLFEHIEIVGNSENQETRERQQSWNMHNTSIFCRKRNNSQQSVLNTYQYKEQPSKQSMLFEHIEIENRERQKSVNQQPLLQIPEESSNKNLIIPQISPREEITGEETTEIKQSVVSTSQKQSTSVKQYPPIHRKAQSLYKF